MKQLLSLLAVKFHTYSFFYIEDILNYIRLCSSFTAFEGQLTYNLGDLIVHL